VRNPDQVSYSYYDSNDNLIFCDYAQIIVLQGSMNNNGCDTAQGTWQNSLGFSGNWAWTKACDVPDGYPPGGPTESSFFTDWRSDPGYGGVSVFTIMVNADRDFGGRAIYEQDAGGGSDDCHWPQSDLQPFTQVTGGTWWIGYPYGYNQTGYDNIGWTDEYIRYYQAGRTSNGLSMPCQANIPQNMFIMCNTDTNQWYKFNWLFLAIDVTQVSNVRDGTWSGWKGYTP
jgi:hypothetical protein